MRNAARLSV